MGNAGRRSSPLDRGTMLRPPLEVTPHSGAVPAPRRGLPERPLQPGASAPWWWVGCHGGAGVSTLAVAVPGGREHGRYWPKPRPGERAAVVVVARSHASGLLAAQDAIQQWASGSLAGVDLLGLAVVADAPGRLPRPIADFITLLSGGVPQLWMLPFVQALRVDTPHDVRLPRPYRSLARYLEG
ncbi:DUF6668 family protein [Nonomuraea sp. NPDC003707]